MSLELERWVEAAAVMNFAAMNVLMFCAVDPKEAREMAAETLSKTEAVEAESRPWHEKELSTEDFLRNWTTDEFMIGPVYNLAVLARRCLTPKLEPTGSIH